MTVSQVRSRNRVGKTDLYISGAGLGTASIGTMYSDVSEAQAIATVHAALAQGITLIDTAPFYGETLVEKRVGLALNGVPRSAYYLSTKVGRPDGTNHMDFSAEATERSLDGSLRRLGTDHVDIVLLHDPDEDTYRQALDEAYPVLQELRRQGAVKAIGVGTNYWEILMDFARDADVDCFLLAGRYTLLEQGALGALNLFAEKGISLFAAGIYNSGILAHGAWYQYSKPPPEVTLKVSQLEAVCAAYDVSLPTAAVRFVSAHPAVSTLIFGAESALQLTQSVERLTTPIPAEFWQTLITRGLLDRGAPLPD
jgi:D-threo-aldose 1-dehydrogenase